MKIQCRPMLAGIAALALWFCAALPSHAQERPLLLSVELRGLDALIQDVNHVALGLQLGPQGSLLAQRLDQSIGGGDFAGIDTNGTARLFLYGRETQPPGQTPDRTPPVVWILPARGDGQAFLATLTNRFVRSPAVDGLTEFRSLPESMQHTSLFAGVKGSGIVMGQSEALVRLVLQKVADGTFGPEQRIGVPGTIALNINAPEVGAMMQHAMAQIGARMPPGAMPMGGPNVAGIMQAEGDMAKAVADQMDALQLGLGTDAKSVVIHTRVAYKPGSELAGMCQAARPPRDEFLHVLPEDLMFTTAGFLGNIDTFLDLYARFTKKILTSMNGEMSAMVTQACAAMNDAKGTLTGDYAMGFGPKANGQGIRYVSYFGVQDAARAKEIFERYAAHFAGTNAPTLPGMQVHVQRQAERMYKDIPITGYRYSVELGPDLPMPPMSATTMGMWTNVLYETAFVGNVGVVASGDEAFMNASLDRLQAPGNSMLKSSVFQSLFPNEPAAARATDIGNVSLVEYVKFILTMVPGMNAQNLSMIPASGSGICGYGIASGNGETSVVKLGIDELVTLKSMIPFLAAGAMAGPPGSHMGPGGRRPARGMPPPGMNGDDDGGMGGAPGAPAQP